MKHPPNWPGVVLDAVLAACVTALGVAHVLPTVVVAGLLGSLIGARVAVLRLGDGGPPSGRGNGGNSNTPAGSSDGSPRGPSTLARVFGASAAVALFAGLYVLAFPTKEAA